MKQDRILRLKQILLTILVLVIIFIGFLIYRAFTFHIISINPASNNMSVISPFFKVNFSKPISNNISVSSTPNIIRSYVIQGKTLDISLIIPMSQNQTYTITVSNIYAISGKHIDDQSYTFTPNNVVNYKLPADQAQALNKSQQQYSETVLNNGLVKLLPFTGPSFEYQINYNIVYTGQTPKIIINIIAPTRQAQEDALSWIRAQGYDTTKLNIQYTLQQP